MNGRQEKRHEGEEGTRQAGQGRQEAPLGHKPRAAGGARVPPADLFVIRNDDRLSLVDQALECWAREQISGDENHLDYRPTDGTCRDSVSSETWDSATDILSRRVDALVVDAVDGALPSLSARERAIVWAVYANRVGPAVWRSSWLSGMTDSELIGLHRAALTTIRPLLRARGLVV